MTTTANLICPKCGGGMRSYERTGVLIDQCEECRGIFLDRGELDLLLDAVSTGRPEDRGLERAGPQRWEAGHDERHGKRRRRGSFLEDLLGGD